MSLSWHPPLSSRILRGRALKMGSLAVGIIALFGATSIARRSQNSALTPDAFAQNALNTIIGDLQQEIAAGSNATYYTDANGNALGSVYQPVSPLAAVPALALKGQQAVVTTFAANLVKRSAYQQNFFPANGDAGAVSYNNSNTAATVVEPTAPGATPSPYTAPYYPSSSRAANAASTVSSQNGFAVLPARWNKALLLPKAAQNLADPTNVTPDSTSFVAPDWVLVASNGSNPTVWTPGLQTSATNPNSVVGRYAYFIYDEGGLLDMTVAGHSSSADVRQVGYKDSLASADLTQTLLTQSQMDAIASWRGSHTFAGRQDLINLLTQTIATDAASRAAVQNSLLYLGTFARGLGQPTYAPISRVGSTTNQNPRPLIQPSTASGSQPGGGNNVGDSYITAAAQDAFSPKLLTLRAEAAFIRNDGSTAATVGEPLIKSRFALQRLAWITYNGPSADNLTGANVQALTTTYGISQAYLQQGTAQNIQTYFGLTWDATNRVWKYNVHNGGTGTSAGTGNGAIMKLPDVADQRMREPDFFELLKGTIDPGSLGKASTSGPYAEPGDSSGTHLQPLNYQFSKDVSVDAAIIQLGANIVDQYDLDGYPTRIVFNDGSATREFRGVENLPYIYRIRLGTLKARDSIPASQPVPNVAGAYQTPYLHSGTQSGYTANPLKDTGAGIVLAVPDIWNPHDQDSALGSPRPGTSNVIRLVADSATPDTIYGDTVNGTPNSAYNTYTTGTFVGTDASHGSFRGTSFLTSPSSGAIAPSAITTPPIPYFTRGTNPSGTLATTSLVMSGSNGGFNNPHVINTTGASYMTFMVPNSTLFREPTLLGMADPTGPSGLTMVVDPSNLDLVNLQATNGSNVLVNTAPIYGFKSLNTNALQSPSGASTQGYIGIALGTYPLRWVGQRWSGSATGTLWNYAADSLSYTGSPAAAVCYSLQYQDPVSNAWVTYDEKYVDSNLSFLDPYNGWINQPRAGAYSFVDPRTSRFGSATESNIGDSAHYRAPLTASPPTNWASTWLDTTSGKAPTVVTERPDVSSGFGSNFRGTTYGDWGGYAAPGLHTANIDTAGGVNAIFYQTGLLAQNNPSFGSDGLRFVGDTGIGSRDGDFWSDPDGVVRRATGGYVVAGSVAGQPLATATSFNNGVGTATSQSQSRPIILNRPFRSVAELGNVFSGNPWKNVDFSTPESAYSELLDVFCINESDAATSPIAGKVNLNTRQPLVLKSVLAGAYTDEENNFTSAPSWSIAPLAAADADAISRLIVARTSTAPPTGTINASNGPQPLSNVGDLVGRWNAAQTITGSFTPSLGSVHNIDGSRSYDGFSADLSTLTSLTTLSTNALKIPRLRESALRVLTNVGNTRVWNLMIDVIAQTGEYPQGSSSLDQFVVEGSQRYWLHVAIDRWTGAVVDQSLEAVPEVPPTDVALSSVTVLEGQPVGTTVGALSATDSNQASTLTYTLVSGTGSDDNASFVINGSTLQTAAAFKYLDKQSYSIRVRVNDQDSLSYEKAITVAVTPSPYTQWKVTNFANQANNPAVAGDLVDSDHDGIVNLLEYALGTSPLTADLPAYTLQQNGNTLQFTYTRLSVATDVSTHVYWTTDLTNANGWTTQGITETLLSDDGTLQHWQATLSSTSNQRAFLRLQVTKP